MRVLFKKGSRLVRVADGVKFLIVGIPTANQERPAYILDPGPRPGKFHLVESVNKAVVERGSYVLDR